MKTYHKIQTVFLRNPKTNYKKLDMHNWAKPEFHFLAEGLICKPQVELLNRFGERIITKIKHKDF